MPFTVRSSQTESTWIKCTHPFNFEHAAGRKDSSVGETTEYCKILMEYIF